MINIRRVKKSDADALLNIYTHYVHTPISFECDVPSSEEFLKRICQISKDYPYLVCEVDGNIVGYAYANKFKEREAYQGGAELTVYIDEKYNGKYNNITISEIEGYNFEKDNYLLKLKQFFINKR